MPRPSSKTVKLQVRVPANVAAFLTAKAHASGMPVTELGGALLAHAAEAEARDEGAALMLPTVRQVVRQELNLFLERLLDFQIRTYMEAGTARRMVQATAYYAEQIATAKGPARLELLKGYEEKQWSATWAAGRRHFEELAKLQALMEPVHKRVPRDEAPEDFPDETAEEELA
ncbi:hypothetical protein DAETH_48770 (plasmid) [Deinococcus aetherius]|uniref:CopG family transcriptional regulator n=1 Tax=Deinococcus aetherius TaxID=200252 RepID=A0ABM8AM38_9DEIO|nr:hypothetical protein [Deinococcus aetherius]BDP44908.1 hypothetical protein DAETH_48770 [Deinococcus aetherius]